MTATTDSQRDSLVGALVEANDQLLALYDLASLSVDTLEEATAVSRILDRAHKLLNTESLILVSQVIYSVGSVEHTNELLAANGVSQSGQLCEVSQSDTEIVLPSGWSMVTVATSTGQSLPLVASRPSSRFGTADKKLLNAVAKLLAGVINTAQLHEQALAKVVIERDHSIASEMAQRALPRIAPEISGLEIFARSEPAHTSGGDLYAWAVVDGIVHFAVGDVAGKGLTAAITMTTAISACNAAFRQCGHTGPASILRSIDQWLSEPLNSREIFVTMVVGSYDPDQAKLTVANAGHSPVMYAGREGVINIPAHFPPVGVLPIEEPLQTVIDVYSGDKFLAASDGLTEQQDCSGRMFGDDRVASIVQMSSTATAASLGSRLFAEVENFAGSAPQSDDRTLVCLAFDDAQSIEDTL